MKGSIAAAGIAMAALLLACGSGNDETAAQPAEATTETAAKTPAARPDAPAETPPVAAAPADATKQCLALAAQQKWSEALEPCTQAAKDHPTDMRIKHAVQQAQAAAAG